MSKELWSEGEYQEHLGIDESPKRAWVTKDGRVVPIASMEDSHLLNTVAFLRRNAIQYQTAEILAMGRCIADAPDDAVDAILDLTDDEYLQRRFPTFRAMLAEARKRGLAI